MFALVHARSNAPNEKVVGSPILEFAQSASVRNAVAAMKRSGRTAETQKRPIATTSGHECRGDRHRRKGAGAGATGGSGWSPGPRGGGGGPAADGCGGGAPRA